MANFYYISGALGSSVLLEQHQESIQRLLAGDYVSSDLEMLKGHHNVYSFRLSRGARLIFTTIEAAGAHHLLLLDFLPTHAYHTCRYLKPQILKQYVLKQQEAAGAMPSDLEEHLEFEDARPEDGMNLKALLAPDEAEGGAIAPHPVFYYKSNMLVLSPTQEASLMVSLPAIVSGVAGSGKSCVALAALAKSALQRGMDRPIWYVTQSPLLVEEMKEQWAALIYEDAPPVEFMTYNELLNRQASRELGKWVTKEHFMAWYSHHVGFVKKIARAKKSLVTDYPDASRAYQECRNASAYTKEAYLSLGKNQSRINQESRAFLYDALEAYKLFLGSKGQIDSSFHRTEMQEGEAPCSFLVVDEAQDLSTLALVNCHAIAQGQVLFCADSHQRVEDDMSVGPFLKQQFSIPEANCVELAATYRCPLKVIAAANEVIRLKHELTGGKIDKDELPRVSGMGGDEKVMGSLYHMDEKALFSNPLINKLAQTTQFAAVTTPERVEELKKRLNTSLVFTPKTIKGLEYDVVVTVGLYEETLFKEMSARLKSIGVTTTPAHRPKAGQEDDRFITPLNQIYVAYTRAKKVLVVCESPKKNTEVLLSRLGSLFNQDTFSDASFNPATKPDDWIEQVTLQIKAENSDLAKEIYLAKISPDITSYDNWLEALQASRSKVAVRHEKERPPTEQGAAAHLGVHKEEKGSAKAPSDGASKPKNPKPSPRKASAAPTIEHVQAQRLYEDFNVLRLTTTLKLVNLEVFLFDNCIKFPNGVARSLMDYICRDEAKSNIFFGCIANDSEILSKIAPLVRNKKNKRYFYSLPLEKVCDETFVGALQQWNNKEFSPLYVAVRTNNIKAIGYLNTLGADLNKACSDGVTPAFIAATLGQTKALRILGKLGADLNRPANDGVTPAFIAAQSGQVAALRVLKKLGADLDRPNNDGVTPACSAVAMATVQIEALRVLAELGADLDKPINDGSTPAFTAVLVGQVEALRVLGELGADLDKPNNYGATPAFIAAARNQVEALRVLGELGADVNKPRRDDATPAFIAAQNDYVEVLRVLKELGADLDRPNNYGVTPAFIAAASGQTKALRVLGELGADLDKPNNDEATPAFIAAEMGQIKALRVLKELGADLNKPRKTKGATPAYVAAAIGQIEVLRVLDELGADLDKPDNDDATPAYAAAGFGQIKSLQVLKELGANLNKPRCDGVTPAFIATARGQIEALRALKDLGADLERPNNEEATPAFIAAEIGQVEALWIFKDLGADYLNRERCDGATPAFIAAAKGQSEALRVLKKLGADLDKTNIDGLTPAFIAAERGQIEALRALDELGADLDMPRHDGMTPACIAVRNRHLLVVELLIEARPDLKRTIITSKDQLMREYEQNSKTVQERVQAKIADRLAAGDEETALHISLIDMAWIVDREDMAGVLAKVIPSRLSPARASSPLAFFSPLNNEDENPPESGLPAAVITNGHR